MVERCVFAVWIGHEVPISDGETDAVEAHDLQDSAVQDRRGQVSTGQTRKGYANDIKSTFISLRSSMVIQVASLSAIRSSAKLKGNACKNQMLQVS